MGRRLITKEQAKDTGLAIVLILLLAHYVKRYDLFIIAAIVILVITMTWPVLFRPAAHVWFGFSHMLGTVVSKIILSIIFYLVVTPIGLLRRILGADPMNLKKWKKTTGSVLVTREHLYSKDDLINPY